MIYSDRTSAMLSAIKEDKFDFIGIDGRMALQSLLGVATEAWTWSRLETALSAFIVLNESYEKQSQKDLWFVAKFTQTMGNCPVSVDRRPLAGLKSAIQELESFVNNNGSLFVFDFYKHLLPKIVAWARDDEWMAKKVPKMPKLANGESSSFSLPRDHVRCLLANMFFVNLTSLSADYPKQCAGYGNLLLARLYASTSTSSIQRILCFLMYFKRYPRYGGPHNVDEITYSRHRVLQPQADVRTAPKKTATSKFYETSPMDIEEWEFVRGIRSKYNINKKVPPTEAPFNLKAGHNSFPPSVLLSKAGAKIITSSGSLDSPPPNMVTTTNYRIHSGEISAGALDRDGDKILFATAPECYIIMLVSDSLHEDEGVAINGAHLVSITSGKQASFLFRDANYAQDRRFNLVLVGASAEPINEVRFGKLAREMVVSYLNMAYIAFSSFKTSESSKEKNIVVSTQSLNSRMNPALEFLAQWMAAAVCNQMNNCHIALQFQTGQSYAGECFSMTRNMWPWRVQGVFEVLMNSNLARVNSYPFLEREIQRLI